jgi:hypothetical protein
MFFSVPNYQKMLIFHNIEKSAIIYLLFIYQLIEERYKTHKNRPKIDGTPTDGQTPTNTQTSKICPFLRPF